MLFLIRRSFTGYNGVFTGFDELQQADYFPIAGSSSDGPGRGRWLESGDGPRGHFIDAVLVLNDGKGASTAGLRALAFFSTCAGPVVAKFYGKRVAINGRFSNHFLRRLGR